MSRHTACPAKIAAQVMAGKTLAAIGFTEEIVPTHVGVKESVFPFVKFAGVDTILGPEMRSTGEVMGIADNFAAAFSKAMLSAGMRLPQSGPFISACEERTKSRSRARHAPEPLWFSSGRHLRDLKVACRARHQC
ncbi:MAG: hypothetical protein H6715_04605 [Myxococcales bacterium]|nr:hypothetical protein [Myxococcales bacterium]